MAPKRGRPSAAAKGKSPMQQQLEQLPLIKKPLEIIGMYINVDDYSSHPNDNRGFTWMGNAALIAQDDALRAAVL